MNDSDPPFGASDPLRLATAILLACQIAILAGVAAVKGIDDVPNAFAIMVVATAAVLGAQRRLAGDRRNAAAAGWIRAWHWAVFALLAGGTAAVALNRLVPGVLPGMTATMLFAIMWAIIALKGAAMGKLRPGGTVGLCVYWTAHSRLAWERAHRVLGRILFWGGLAGLALNFAVPPLTSLALWGATVLLAVTAALLESWRSWRLDPDRTGGTAA